MSVKEAGDFAVHSDVEGVPLDRTNLCVRAFEALHPADRLSFRIRSEIPVSAGLGSSAAAIVAGLAAANQIADLDAPLLKQAIELEGHPDNVAAALLGGFVICASGQPERFDPPAGLEAVLATPPHTVSTSDARAALPAEVPLTDAVHNIAHAALLVLGLVRGDLDLVGRGLSDRIHQVRRAELYPRSIELLGDARKLGAIGASISGAGPTVLFWCRAGDAQNCFEQLRADAADCELRQVSFATEGASIRRLRS